MKKFILLIVCYLFLQFGMESIVSDDLIYDSLINQLSYERISEMLDQGKKWKWLSYVFLPVLIFFKIFFVAICFSIGGLLLNVEIGFKKFLSIATNSEFVFLIPGMVKLVWFTIFKTSHTLQDIQYFAPFSAINFFNPTELDPWLVYPLLLLNAFEVLYWVVLGYQLREVLSEDLSGSIGFVTKTYGLGLFIWVVMVMFLIVSIS
jgi:hypothetical protein